MTLMILCALMLCALCALIFKKMKLGMSLSMLSLFTLVLAGYGVLAAPLLGALQSAFIAPQPVHWTANNAIVVLGAGTEKVLGSDQVEPGFFSYARLEKTAQLYSDCTKGGHQCKVLISGGDPQNHGISEAEIYSSELLKSGIDQADLILEKSSRSTWENAQRTSAALKQNHFFEPDTVVLVTSGLHLQRSMLYFSHFGIHATPIRSDYVASFNERLPVAVNLMLTDAALHEYFGIWRFHLYEYLGWNDRVSKEIEIRSRSHLQLS